MIRGPPRPALFPYATLFRSRALRVQRAAGGAGAAAAHAAGVPRNRSVGVAERIRAGAAELGVSARPHGVDRDRKSTRLNSSHANISYAVFCLTKKLKLIVDL